MSRLTDLIRQAKEKDPTLGLDLEAEFAALSSRRQFGLNFERHQPEAVELPGRPPRKGDKVRVLPTLGSTAAGDQRLWKVAGIVSVGGTDIARLHITNDDGKVLDSADQPLEDVVVVAEFRDPIYPGLVSTGTVERGGDKPSHIVINAENFHALQTLQFTHRGKVDAIYIDPPYNTGAKDWKYNNDYVDGEDVYRHSKWLAFMERRLRLAKELLNPDDSVLVVTIDEKEVHRLAIVLEQTFPEARIQQVTSVISSQASVRDGSFARCDEFIFFVMLGSSSAGQTDDDMLNEGLSATKSQLWFQFVRTGAGNKRADRKGMFYPIFADPETGQIHSVGDSIASDAAKEAVVSPQGTIAIWPETSDGQEGRWRTGPEVAARRAAKGLLRLGRTSRKTSGWSVMTVNSGTEARIASGEVIIEAMESNGAARLKEVTGGSLRNPKTVWNRTSHNAGWHGSKLLSKFIPGRKFPFPKSLYAVEDALRFFIQDKPDAVVLDFFAGSGSTAHAVMRLNRQDGGRRQSISVTNNEVSTEEQKRLRRNELRPGDPEWEALGICDYITKPRIKAAITGLTPDGKPIKGEYKFTDEFPMAEGFEENVDFFTLTYESPWRVTRGRAFDTVAPLLWMRAGSEGRRIQNIPPAGWHVSDVYGVIADLDQTELFLDAVTCSERVRAVFIVTDDDRAFQSVCAALPERVEPVRLYESYLRNFEIKGRD